MKLPSLSEVFDRSVIDSEILAVLDDMGDLLFSRKGIDPDTTSTTSVPGQRARPSRSWEGRAGC